MLKVGGLNEFNQLCAHSNSEINSRNTVNAPFYSSFNVYSVNSFSVYKNHAVWITKDGIAHAIGDNTDCQISPLLPKCGFKEDMELSMTYDKTSLNFISAVCGSCYTLYMLLNPKTNQIMLAYSYSKKTIDSPLFLRINFRKPIGLFGGDVNSAAIDSRGAVIFVNISIFESPTATPQICVLPNNDKAVSVACCNKFIVVLSKSGRVYFSTISIIKNDSLSFSEITGFEGQVVDISGTREHCLAVTSNGRVYGYGFNNCGQLGMPQSTSKLDRFQQIASLRMYNIKAAYAGYVHSLFQTDDGMILACGKTNYASLLIAKSSLSDLISTPTKTVIEKGASYANAGMFLSAVFVGCQAPNNAPNKKVSDNFTLLTPSSSSTSVFSKTTCSITSLKKTPSFTPDKLHVTEKQDVKSDDEKESHQKEKDYLSQIDKLNRQILAKEAQIKDLQKSSDDKVAELNRQIQNQSNRTKDLQKSSSERIAELDNQVQIKTNQIKDLQKSLNDKDAELNKQIKLKTSRIEELEDCNNKQKKTIQELEEKMKSKNQSSSVSKETKSDNYFIGEDDEKYQIVLEEIGKGSTSISFKIIDTRWNQVICKKVIYLDKNEVSFKEMQNAMKEFEILYVMKHPCICQAIGINTSEMIKNEENNEEMTTVALFLEFIDYKLKDLMTKKYLNNTLKARIVLEIAHAMNYLHKLGHIHRDLNIDNIMLNAVFQVKIIDFGLAKINECLFDMETLNTISMTKGVGAYEFMSPEMVREEDYDNKTDVYSFGIILYFLFVGNLPKQSMAEKARSAPIKMPSPSDSISKFCIDLISECLSNNPEDRPSFEMIIEKLKNNSYNLASKVDNEIVSSRHKELDELIST
ncbi:hypothetical protein M9Y10_007669 [Tritrichomonas musculus]|uniref:Protein kinase domain-containing protein n=1 Tax=Tritrichomonas musculus TaxID=1915356 RepID=A0ABR2J1Z9_9EUKA